MLDGKHDFSDFYDDQSASPPEGRLNISELLAKLDSLEKEMGCFIRETFQEANSTGARRVGAGD
jgi:hypothetical protein